MNNLQRHITANYARLCTKFTPDVVNTFYCLMAGLNYEPSNVAAYVHVSCKALRARVYGSKKPLALALKQGHKLPELTTSPFDQLLEGNEAQHALRNLHPRSKLVITELINGSTISQVANKHNINLNTCKNLRKHGLKKLREKLEFLSA